MYIITQCIFYGSHSHYKRIFLWFRILQQQQKHILVNFWNISNSNTHAHTYSLTHTYTDTHTYTHRKYYMLFFLLCFFCVQGERNIAFIIVSITFFPKSLFTTTSLRKFLLYLFGRKTFLQNYKIALKGNYKSLRLSKLFWFKHIQRKKNVVHHSQ